jgi:hypothetical protein
MSGNPMDDPVYRRELAERIARDRGTLHVPPGHPYSPIPSPEDVERALARADAAPRALPGIDLRQTEQFRLLGDLLPLYGDLRLEDAEPGRRFRLDNDYFTGADAVYCALLLRRLRPRRVVEVGCGHSTALALDIDERFLGSATRFLFVEPDACRLRSLVPERELEGRLVEGNVQDVPLERFEELAAGDVLLVDSSHVLKAGSDVQHLIDEVFPRLAVDVRVHVHDVFYPFEYPRSWLATGCAVNEAYAVRALLQSSRAFEIELFAGFVERFHGDWLARHMPVTLSATYPTGGIWLRRT